MHFFFTLLDNASVGLSIAIESFYFYVNWLTTVKQIQLDYKDQVMCDWKCWMLYVALDIYRFSYIEIV